MSSTASDQIFSSLMSTQVSDLPYQQEVFDLISGIAIDSEGSIIFVDKRKGKIGKLNLSNRKTITIAGSSTPGFKDGKGLSASFNYPQGIAIDSDDVIYVGDLYNRAIRKISKDGIVSTIISGDNVGYIYDLDYFETEKTIFFVSITFVGRIKNDGSGYKLWAGSSQKGYKDGKGEVARFTQATTISVNQITGHLYVSEVPYGLVRKIDQQQIVTTLLRDLRGPWGLYAIKNESLIIPEYFGNRIRRYSFETQAITEIAGTGNPGLFDGSGKDADICQPCHVTWNPLREEIVFSEQFFGLRVINKFNYVSTILMPTGYGLEDGPAHKARVSLDLSLDMDEKEETIYFVDLYNNSLRKASILNGTVTTMAGKAYSGNVNGNLSNALFSNPTGLSYYKDSLLIADNLNNVIKKVSLKSNIIENFLNPRKPDIVSIDQSKSSFYYTESRYGSPIAKYDINGDFILELGSGTSGCVDGIYNKASFMNVRAIYTMADGTAYLTDSHCNTIRVFDPKTLYISVLAGTSEFSGYADGVGGKALFDIIWGLDYFPAENVFYISDYGLHLIRQSSVNGNVTTFAGSLEGGYRNGPIEIALFKNPKNLKVLSNGNILVCDDGNNAVRIIKKKDGVVETLFGYGSKKYHRNPGPNVDLNSPISITSKDTMIYILNKEDNNILGYDLNNQLGFLLAGNGAIGWSDGDSLQAMFNRPEDIHYSADIDSIFVADTQNHLIRKVSMDGNVSTFAGTGKKGYRNDIVLASDFNLPSSVTTDPNGNIFVADSGNNVIRKISNGKVSLYAGSSSSSSLLNGRLLSAKFSFPTGIAYNNVTGCLIVADMYNHAIRSINGSHASTLAGNGTSGYLDGPYVLALFAYPRKVGVDENGVIFVTDSYNDRIRKLSNETVTSLQGNLLNPVGLHVSKGVLYVSEYSNNVIKSMVIAKSTRLEPYVIATDSIIPIVILTICTILLVSFVSNFFMIKRRKSINVTDKLKHIQTNTVKSLEQTGTITLNQTRAHAIPGYLELNLSKAVNVSEYVGSGSTAKVILGTLKDPSLITKHNFIDVAVKFLNETENMEDFYYEITIMSAFPKSDYIVEFIGYSKIPPVAIVMKNYPANLSDVISSGTYCNDFELLCKFSMDIAKGMEIVHNHGVIHFDLKPANILLHNVNKSLTCAICDFGFANFTFDAKINLVKGIKTPRTNGITARYASPEQFQASKYAASDEFKHSRLDDEVYKKVDVFAYAMTIFFIFTGYKPWQNEDKIDQIEKLVCAGERPEFPAKDVVPIEIRDIIIRCWSHNILDRPSFSSIVENLNNKTKSMEGLGLVQSQKLKVT